MKNLKLFLSLCLIFFITSGVTFADDFFSVKSGNWSDADTWDLNAVPASGDNVMIEAGHTVTINLPITFSGILTCDGYLKEVAVMTKSGTPSFTFNNGSTYELAHVPATDAGIPTATWNTGSTCLITGVTSATTSINANQNFHHFIVDCPSWSGNLNMGWGGTSASAPITIGGNVTVKNTGAGRWQWCAPLTGISVTVTVNGNLIIDGSTSSATALVVVTSNGTGTANTHIAINVLGNVVVTGNPTNIGWTNFSISRGSQGGTGTAVWNLYGNFTMSDATTQNSTTLENGGRFNFVKTGIQTISWTNVTQASTRINLQVNTASTLQLNSSLSPRGIVTLNGGMINTTTTNLLTIPNDAAGAIGGSITGGTATSFVNGPLANTWGTATLAKIYPIGSGSVYRPVEVSLTTPASPVLRMQMVNSNAGGDKGSLDAISVIRYFQSSLISGTAASGGTVKLSYGADDGVQTSANLVVAQSTTANGTYSSLGMSANDASSVTSASFNPASGDFLLLGSNGGNSLPVQLASFIGNIVGNNAQLEWQTISEVNNYGFNVQRLNNISNNYETIGFVAGKGVPYTYTYEDENVSGSLEYRLEQIDNDGLTSYFGPIMLNPNSVGSDPLANGPAVFELKQNYPNPFNPSTVINYQLAIDNYTTLKVYNLIGKEVATLVNGNQSAGSHQVTFDGSALTSGIYFYKLQSGSSVEVKKLTLVK